MEKLNLEQLSKNIEALLKVLTLMSKLSILIGGICISAYSLEIGHFPQGLTIGDGLLFMLTAACFGIIYVFFVVSLISLGMVLSPITKFFLKVHLWTYKFRSTPKPVQVYEFAKFKWIYVIFAVFAVMFILGLGRRDMNAYWNLPLLSIAMYFFYCTYLSSGDKMRSIEASLQKLVHINETRDSSKGKIETLRKAQILSLAVLLLMPMFTGGVTGQLLDGAMRKASIRVEKATIYVKEPYATLLPAANKSPIQSSPNQYVKFEKMVILFRGLGNSTVLWFQDGTEEKKLEVPNDQLIIGQ
jgi:hypothetical protein